MTQVPSVGRIVHYVLSEEDVNGINRRRADGESHMSEHRERSDGSQVHIGNRAVAGAIYPLIITRVWGSDPTSGVNGQVLLDGNDAYWATSRVPGETPGTWHWPERV